MVVGHDGVVATLHVFDCCIGAVAIGRIRTSGTCVRTVETQAVGPAIVHGEPIIGCDGGGWYRLARHCRWWCLFGSGARGSSSGVENIWANHEFAEVFFVFGSEVSD